MFAIHNFGPKRAKFVLDVGDTRERLHDVLAFHRHEAEEGGRYRIELEPYGYRWLRCGARR